MWQAVRLLFLLLSAAGLFMMENTPSGLRDNICSWKILYPCPEWFGTAHVDGALQILIWLLIVGLSLSLIMPFVVADYRRTIAFMTPSMASGLPCGAGDRQQDPELINGRAVAAPIILAELETTVPRIGNFTPVCSIRITNTGPPLENKCVVQVEKHGLKIHMPDPLVVRTEGQIRNDRTGPFSLRAGQPKLVPIFFRDPGRINEFRFIGEDKNHYSFIGDSAEFEVAIYGAEHPTRVSVRLNVGEDWKIHAEMEYC